MNLGVNLVSAMKPGNFNVLDPLNTRDLSPDLLDENGRIKVAPAAYYAKTTAEERALFGHRNSAYGFVTAELVEWLKLTIAGRSSIEIGAGNGVLAGAVGIPATDNRMQEEPAIKALYASTGQPVVKYGDNVEKLDAGSAVRKYKPQVVIANWVTHLYREDRHEHGGNAMGVNEEDILAHCETYIFIGNARVHEGKSIWKPGPEKMFVPDWLYSRSMNGSPNFIACFKGERHPEKTI